MNELVIAIEWSKMGAGHFVFIPATLLIGIVIGWILGSRAAVDAFRADQRRREERAQREAHRRVVEG